MKTEKEQIKIIEDIELCDSHDKANLILVYLGLKPACEVKIYRPGDVLKLKKILGSIGLSCVKSKCFDKKAWNNIRKLLLPEKMLMPIASYAIAKGLKIARELSKIGSSKDHRRYGELMGYPLTAINNFVNRDPQVGHYKLEKIKKKHGIVFGFRLPEKNYRNELALLIKWSEAIKKYTPSLYKELLKNKF